MRNRNIKAECPECLSLCNHVLHFEIYRYDTLFPDLKSIFQIIQCKGCETISLQYKEREKNGKEIVYNFPSDHLYPATNSEIFLKTKELKEMPKIVQGVYKEMKLALNSGLNLLAGIGLRMIVESVCIDQQISGHNLKEKIIELQKLGHISVKALPVVDRLREIGNISAHKIQSIEIESLKHAVEIVNHLLKSVYILSVINVKIKT
jgi:hypothetical protein